MINTLRSTETDPSRVGISPGGRGLSRAPSEWRGARADGLLDAGIEPRQVLPVVSWFVS